jgi:hypothetical protein
MKTLTLIAGIILSQLTLAQSKDLTGMWISNESNEDMPIGIEFQADGNLNVYEMKEENNTSQVYSILDGNYYYEDGSDILVIITWYGDQAKTSIYNYSFENDELIISPRDTENSTLNYSREDNLANL